MKTLGQHIKQLRGTKSLSQLSRECGIDKGYLSKIERDERKPKPEMLDNIAKAYGGDYNEMLEICGYKEPDPVIIRRIRKATEKMDKKQQKKMMDVLKQSFGDLFVDDSE